MVKAAEFLVRSQNADGGWGYRVGGMSYVEPTAAVLLALERYGDRSLPNARGRDFLLSLQHADGGWGIGAIDAESGWMTAWAVMALATLPDTQAAIKRGVGWLLATEGTRVTDPAAREQIRQSFQMDSALRGWPWQSRDGAWVHPTALALLALVAAGERDHARVQNGVEYLLDRAVSSGGWNVGNPQMLAKPIPATIQDTAIALCALDAVAPKGGFSRKTTADSQIAKAIQFLQTVIAQAKTPAALAWGIYALRVWNVQVEDALVRLNGLQSADGSWQANPFITAIVMLATS